DQSVEVIACWPVEDMGKAEADLHQRFDHRRVQGEWFRLTQDELQALLSSVPLKGTTKGIVKGDQTPSSSSSPSGEIEANASISAAGRPSRKRDELFDAVAEVTASDPKASGSHIGKVCAALRSADPPYTPTEVRSLPKVVTERGLSMAMTLGVVE